MNLEETILKEHSKKQCDKIVRYIGISQERFAELMKLFFECYRFKFFGFIS